MIHLIVGNTGSGKTTYATTIKAKSGGVLFSIDAWNSILFLEDKKETDGLDWFLERIERAEKMICNLISQLEESKVDAILDLGLSKLEHREKFRTYAKQRGYQTTTYFLDISKETRLKRVLERNEVKGDTYSFDVSQENFDFMETWFEKPLDSEMENGILITE